MNPVREDIIWAAGLFEGEGSFHINNKTTNKKDGSPPWKGKGVVVSLGSTDMDVLEEFQRCVMGMGKIRNHSAATEKHRQSWVWSAGKFEDAQTVIAMLWPWLCSRRKAQVTRVLLEFREYQTTLRTYKPDTRRIL